MKIPLVFKALLTVALLGIILLKANLQDILHIFLSFNPLYLSGALVLVPLMYLLRTVRWNLILQAAGVTIPFSASFRFLLIGNFYGLVTPGHVGEIGRAYHIPDRKARTIPTVILEKVIDICTLIILCFATVAAFFRNDPAFQIGVVVCGFILVMGVFFLTNRTLMLLVTRWIGVGEENCHEFIDTFRSLLRNYRLIGYSFLISAGYYGIAYLLGYLLILSAGFDPVVLITLPVIVLVGNIPVTISGLGLRESTGSVAFMYLGETAADGFVYSFTLFLLISLIPGICGYLLTMKEH